MPIGILGGSFAPIHNAHIEMAEIALKEKQLDKIVFVPATLQYYKSFSMPIYHRLNMLEIALEDKTKFEIDNIEMSYPNNLYSVYLLELLKKKYGDDIYYIIGGDSLLSIEKWYKHKDLLENNNFLVLLRGEDNDVKEKAKYLNSNYKTNIELLNTKPKNISSTEIRFKILLEDNVYDLIDKKVLNYIQKNHLFDDYKVLLNRLRKDIGDKRYFHGVRVAIKAIEINKDKCIHNFDIAIAGIMHDIAKDKPREIIDKYTYAVPEEYINTPIEHGFISAEIAKHEYYIVNDDILNAIKYHTIARPNMGKIEKLIFVSDMVEDNRKYDEADYLRKVLNEDINKGLKECLKHKIEFYGDKTNKNTKLAYEFYSNKEI